MEVNTLYVKKLTMNKAEIIFDKIERALEWEEFLKKQRVESTKLVWNCGGTKYFGFKMFRCRYQMPTIIFESNRRCE